MARHDSGARSVSNTSITQVDMKFRLRGCDEQLLEGLDRNVQVLPAELNNCLGLGDDLAIAGDVL